MKIDTKYVLKDITGDELKNESGNPMTIGYILGRILVINKVDPLRAYILGSDIYKSEGEYEVNKSDLDYITEAVKSNDTYYALVRGQLLEILTQKEEKVGSKK